MTAATHSAYREAIEEALAGGWRFGGLYATAGGTLVRSVLLGDEGRVRFETVSTGGKDAPSIVDLAPSASWDEREAHDLHGVTFTGHEPLRPLVDHDPDLRRWTVPVRGHDAYQVAVGPIHAGIIESGHFRFHVVGDRILHVDARLFYKHRGLERAAEGRALDEGAALVGRACGACAVANRLAYAHACEESLGLVPTVELARTRTMLLELERAWSHLNDIAAVCAGVGLAAGNNRFAGLVERARRVNARLAGHRLLFGAVRVGGSDLDVPAETVREARRELATIAEEAGGAWRELEFNASFQDRLPDVGVLHPGDAERLGTVGPAARASGSATDTRSHAPRLAYGELEAVVPEEPTGDVRARLEQRALELRQTHDLLDRLLDGPISPSAADAGGVETELGAGIVESARGATLCVVERANDRLARVHLRTGSFANWPSVAHVAEGNLLPDFPLINKSFELCYACVDR